MKSISGWLRPPRILKKVAFFELINKDIQQCVVTDTSIIQLLQNIPIESIVQISGTMQPSKSIKHKEEWLVSNINVINSCKDLPFDPRSAVEPHEIINRQTLRYVHLRNPKLQHDLRLRSNINFKVRQYLIENEFVEIETPTLFKPTSEGANEFLVPKDDTFYALTQSPQQFKQLLMVGGFQKYFQIAKCYRNEDHRADRQPEFTQIDLELSFTSETEIKTLVKDLLKVAFSTANLKLDEFVEMSYKDAMLRYGCDKPDIRLPYSLITKGKLQILTLPKADLNLNTFLRDLDIPFNESHDSLIFIQNLSILDNNPSDTPVGRMLRLLVSLHLKKPLTGFKPVWITDFPLFKMSKTGIKSCHHPFTRPKSGLSMNLENKLKELGSCFDVVINGNELASGSMRIHEPELQTKIFDILELTEHQKSQFSHLIDGLGSGCPPHGGIAIGLDRLMAIICNESSIQQVIAFPKASNGRDLCFGSPASK